MTDVYPVRYTVDISGNPDGISELLSGETISNTLISGLGDSATKNVGTTSGTVAVGDHTHSGPSGYALDSQVIHNFGNETNLSGNKGWTGVHNFSNATASTTTSTGAVVISAGGLGVFGAINAGADSTFNSVVAGMTVGGVQIPTYPAYPPPPPPSGTVTTYCDPMTTAPAWIQPSRLNRNIQASLGYTNFIIWMPTSGSNTPVDMGSNMTYNGGNPSGVTPTTTNVRTRQIRVRQQAANGTNKVVSNYSNVASHTIGTGSGLGGFHYALKFAPADTTLVTSARMFAGLTSSTSAPTNVEPSTLTNVVGVGKGIGDSNLKIFYGGSTAQTPIDLGVNFPANTNVDLYLLEIHADPFEQDVHYRITRIGTTYVIDGKITNTVPGTTLPANTTLLAHKFWRATTTVSGQVAIETGHLFIDQLL